MPEREKSGKIDTMLKRGSGILLHVTSLPSSYGIGDLGPEAYAFIDFLAENKQRFWQILPLNPTDQVYGNSPYSSVSAFAGNLLFISPELLVRDGFLCEKDLQPIPEFPHEQVNYKIVTKYKEKLLTKTHQLFSKKKKKPRYEAFCRTHSFWLQDFALFTVLKSHFKGKDWSRWPDEIRNRKPSELTALTKQFHEKIEREKFFQYIFFTQWLALKQHCSQKNIHIIGDIPIYVNYDSVDVWTHPEIFKLDKNKKPTHVAGVPPDYFSATGQLWGNPVYQWKELKKTSYAWWMTRLKHTLSLCDLLRIDHFRGFAAYWQIPVNETTAINGKWVDGPRDHFFELLRKQMPQLPIIAEDLGLITPDVKALIKKFNLPGMKVLLFAFDGDSADHPYVPHNHIKNCILYTGTHDNNTVQGWFAHEATAEAKQRLFRYLKRTLTAPDIHWEFIRMAMKSIANVAIIPMQDILGLNQESRMNQPGTGEGNWQWRLAPEYRTPTINPRLLEMTQMYGRA